MRSRLVLPLLLTLPIITCCATRKPAPEPQTYTIPVVKRDGRVDTFTVEPDPGDPERMLFCVEMPAVAVCMAERNGRALRYVFPLPEAPPHPNSQT